MKPKSNSFFYIAAFALFIAVTLFSYYEYRLHKTKLYDQIDEKLLSAAEGATLILPTDFYDKAVAATSIAPAEDKHNIDRLSQFAKTQKVTYVYMMIQKEDKIYFTASNATDEERKSGVNLTHYFDEYTDADTALKNTFQTRQTAFAEYTDKWGTFRSVFLPMKTPAGTEYVVAADIQIDTITQLLNKEIFNLMVRLLVVIGTSLLFLTWHLRKTNQILDIKVRQGEKNLKNSYERLQNVFDAMHEGVYEVDKEGNCTLINKTFLKILGYQHKDEIIGKNIHALIHHSHPDGTPYPKDRCAMLDVFNHHHPVHIENEVFWSKNGRAIPVEYWSNPIIVEGKFVAAMATFVDISERKQTQDHIHQLTNFDSLTNLPNRQKLLLDLEEHHPYGCALFNIDNFKEMNDFFGIIAGDTLLCKVADWFKEMGLFPYRIGGDEFVILFYENLTQDKLHSRIVTLLSALDEERFSVESETLNIRMSVGVATGIEKLLIRADIALHTAQERKIPIAFYEESENIEKQFQTNIAMAATIRKALANGRIVCHYQPIMNIETGKIDKYETLVRMIDEEGSMIGPLQFLPIAKKTKLYPRITKEVLHQACHLFSSRDEEFSINLSIDDIHEPSTVQEILSTISKTGTASRIVFEILESDGIENYGEVAQFTNEVKKLGAKVAIDDFGTGYSNFEHILKLNVDYIKIDGSLIREIADNPRHQIIVQTIIEFAQKMGAKTIAEFVSDERIFNTLQSYGIDYSQGYFTGKPQELLNNF